MAGLFNLSKIKKVFFFSNRNNLKLIFLRYIYIYIYLVSTMAELVRMNVMDSFFQKVKVELLIKVIDGFALEMETITRLSYI